MVSSKKSYIFKQKKLLKNLQIINVGNVGRESTSSLVNFFQECNLVNRFYKPNVNNLVLIEEQK